VNKGIENIITESCYPHKIAHGHIKDLIEQEVDAIFLPSFINFNADGGDLRSYACPYAQTMPYIAETAFDSINIIKPAVNMEYGSRHIAGEISSSLKQFNISRSAVSKAMEKADTAQMEFTAAVKERGREILASIRERTVVIVGRAYNSFDPGINLEIPKKLAALGVFSIPQDFLPIETIDIKSKWTNMYWRSGQNILKAAEIIKANPKLFALYISNFSCGPDSFIHRYFDKTMAGKPFLHIEIDEHSADAGVITRCEAFLDSISGRDDISSKGFEPLNMVSIKKGTADKTVYVPRMSDHAFGLAAAFRMCGLNAEVMDPPTPATVKIGRRHVSGKECYPCAITTGDMVNKTLSNDFDHKRSVFFMPSGTGPCRFGQYNILQRIVLDEIGLPHVPIYSPNQDVSFYTELGIVGNDFTKQAWKGIVAIDLLMKCLHETRPYEVNKGETDRLYNDYFLRTFKQLQQKSGDMSVLLHEIKHAFSAIPVKKEKRPLIGIIGEIFVRHNTFANENIIRKIEELGGEVWLAPAEEWLFYVNHMAIRKSWIKLKNDPFSASHLRDITNALVTRHIKKSVEHEYSRPFENYLKTLKEPSTKEMFVNALPYLQDSFEGEAVLSMGKAVDFTEKGACGIISAMPFGCMPGTIVSALMKGFRKNTGVPCLSVAYDGSEANCSGIQLEAFMYQANEFLDLRD
jgi:predicted nucleotide-binding protein (sugar kinase/HSP70/actin superfamily)